ncbi:hypothetical protein [Desulfuribacillus alkaliarsenatis]|uniref:Uncharacterized protein n=1 Tax=Desulfuribacillus alkaliarsenatis TaxID=766136 RepID=A0A1E5G2B4_9FIRM|nr:hypothetical protein [Desulfuribacillus alkaliarsenatis]OEF97043.1 hypothetical protein BHF68_05440 [Desulfuribacillus alkaliarsenatis]
MSICLNIRTNLEEHPDINLRRLADIENYFKQLAELHNNLYNITKQKQMGLDAKLRWNNTILKRREELEKQLLYHYNKVKSETSEMKQHLDQLISSSKGSFINENIDLQVEYDEEGNIVEIQRLKRVN